MKKVNYTNWSTAIFQGFYESNLYNSDSEYYAREYLGEDYELQDFKGFCNKVATKAGDLLHEQVVWDDSLIQRIDFVELDSPEFYNYRTDRLVLSVDVDMDGLEEYCFEEHAEKFAKHLEDNFTSYDGFHSFISNTLGGFKEQYVEEDKTGRCLHVMIEFYILQNIDLDSYQMNLVEYAQEELYNHLEPTSPIGSVEKGK
jgi:hypothetical protein